MTSSEAGIVEEGTKRLNILPEGIMEIMRVKRIKGIKILEYLLHETHQEGGVLQQHGKIPSQKQTYFSKRGSVHHCRVEKKGEEILPHLKVLSKIYVHRDVKDVYVF